MNIRNRKKISLPVKYCKKETPPCVCIEGSYMAELSLALPFFAGFMALLLFFFQALAVQQEVGNALLSAGRELSVLECRAGSEQETGNLMAKALLLKRLPKDSSAEQFIKGGRSAIVIRRNQSSSDMICLQADYRISFPSGLFGKQGVNVTQKFTCRKWTGRRNAQETGEIVYITKSGSVYHRKRDCTYLCPMVRGVGRDKISKLRNEGGGKYYACISCIKNRGTNSQTVYITKYGDRYHSRKDCRKIWHTVFAVRLSEAADRRACSKCGKE